ncbi:unnamed protein product [Aspergillus oryzae RIB40]|uniref:DNA, SC003 n=2 Tax=Aspergillus oryzae TaxID=5062 RepID=Q2UM24_ASPOR|nr:unnamed protein product [Aspergillus oryzae RIB40]EIT73315.1 Na+/H+ antiporter [Aspergillus oryzae 3.042]KDE78283.1 Na+/H+ antiporter [Aspergillus oryzae 100-8]BAE57391.1 unnamed protein product [Aspergillus oryzae RIB40]|eukprot:EIT73315.1 Na+/H+ antiporter [Aspergillus oryzae 3.042]
MKVPSSYVHIVLRGGSVIDSSHSIKASISFFSAIYLYNSSKDGIWVKLSPPFLLAFPLDLLALTRLVIGIQLVKVGYQLPKRYIKQRSIELTFCLLPLMGIGWVITSSCIMLMVPNLSFLAALIIGSCVTCTDPILSQAIAKGPFADKYVRRHLREFISSEAGGNDGFGFTFLLLAVSLLRYAETPANAESLREFDLVRGIPDVLGAADVGRFGGGVGKALKHWVHDSQTLGHSPEEVCELR